MASTESQSRAPSKLLTTTFGYIVLVLLPLGLAVLLAAVKVQPLRAPRAMDHAQLARHLVEGQGFVTSVVRPLSLTIAPAKPNPPDLYNAPLHPLLLSYCLKGQGDPNRAVALTGIGLWVVSIWLTFLVARNWFGSRTAGLAALFYGSGVMTLAMSVEGLPVPLLAIVVLLVLWLAVPNPGSKEPVDKGEMTFRIPLAGAACAMALLTHYLFFVLALVMAVYYVTTARHRWAALWRFGYGFLIPLAPWLVRNLLVTGSPVFSLYWYEFQTGTWRFPGESLWRGVDQLNGPWLMTLVHPLSLGYKVLTNLGGLRFSLLSAFEPVSALLFLAAWFSSKPTVGWRRLLIVTTAGIAMTLLGLCALRPEMELLLAWAPVIAIAAAGQLTNWVQRTITADRMKTHEGVVEKAARPERMWGLLSPLSNSVVAAGLLRMGVYAAVILVAFAPMLYYLVVQRPMSTAFLKARGKALSQLLPEKAVVMTDEPTFIAWHVNRRAVMLCQREKDLDWIEKNFEPLHALYVTTGATRRPEASRSDWWGWVLSPVGEYRDFVAAPPAMADAVLRIHVPGASFARSGPAPSSSDGFTQRGLEMLAAGRLREAVEDFREAVRLDPENAEAVIGFWQVKARLLDRDNKNDIVQLGLAVDSRDPRSRILLENAAKAVQEALGEQPNDPWFLLQGAAIEAKAQNWEGVDSYLQPLKQWTPKSLPPELLLANLDLQYKRFQQAYALLEPLRKEQSKNAAVYDALGRLYEARDDFAVAMDAYRFAQQLRPGWALPYLRAGYLCLKQKQYAEAISQLKNHIQINPRSFSGNLGLARALEENKQPTRALEIYEGMLTNWPGQRLVMNNLALLYADTGKDIKRAVELAETLGKSDTNNPVLLDTQGWVYYRAGRAADAVKLLERAVALYPSEAIVQYHYAKALAAAGKTSEARDVIRRAIAIGLPPKERLSAEDLLGSLNLQ